MAKNIPCDVKEKNEEAEDFIFARIKAPMDLWNKMRSHCILSRKNLPDACVDALVLYLLVHEHDDFGKFMSSAKEMNVSLWDYVISVLEKEERK
jgi:hypothetical protein